MFHHLLNLQTQTRNRGSPNNNDYYIPEGYERPARIGNRPLLFSSGYSETLIYNYSIYARTKPMFNHYYNNLREEENGDRAINWLSKIPRNKWTLAWNNGHRWGHMTTNLVKSINSILKKTQNMLINALIKSTYISCNTLFNQIRKDVTTMLTFDQVYTQVLNKVMEDT